ncbi:flagellin N-terminal helical domain-containing protein [Sporolactobacillus putidus]|uniref:Flagellin n=1 Tax=Sporolactobacillus putidus TaxID=492735 RepID=A0A917S3B2_9BACL|nr:flagellin [Sporolactobacillus putidus]GGL54505.1 flagellin [Sporolactobacillus putidus]
MIINHNIAALNTLNQLTKNQNATQQSLQKLSSGLRINSAADDAAGLAISQKMQGQIRGLNQASNNAQDASNLLQTGEGALAQTQDILQRMRELAVQSANDTNTAQDRQNIQDEMNSLTKTIDNIASTTQFNTKNLLDGSMGAGVANAVQNVNTSVSLNSGAGKASATTTLSGLKDSNGNSLGIAKNDTISVSYIVNGKTTTNTFTVASGDTLTTLGGKITSGTLTVNGSGALVETAKTSGYTGAINGISITVTSSSGAVRNAASNALSSFTETTAAANKRADGSATFQIGANTGQNLTISIENMSTAALGVNGLQVTSQGSANVAIKAIDNAIQKVSAARSKMGASENALQYTVNNLTTSSQNLTSASSRITDVNMAQEMSNFTKNNILSQAAQSMLYQANQLPQGVLQLLR